MVLQLAKQAGMKVITSAGSVDKVAFMCSLRADAAFNYRTADMRAVLEKEGPVDLFWDNVGSEVVGCGTRIYGGAGAVLGMRHDIGYNTGQQAIKEKIFYETIPPQLASGALKYSEEITTGLDKVGEVISAVQRGTNRGKAVVVAAEQ
ncbi:hypothetical protein B0H14DRAFT_3477619 [Mycena olivaceomarginata]|nr:hypothetical protein B0H14DRAFT_3477619 [Mycena olivaceomarginata]